MFKYFLAGFLSVFRFGQLSVAPAKCVSAAEALRVVEHDINNSYQKLTKLYEEY